MLGLWTLGAMGMTAPGVGHEMEGAMIPLREASKLRSWASSSPLASKGP